MLHQKGLQTNFVCRKVDRNNLGNTVEAMVDIVENYPDCVFDLTGGEDLYLVAIGIVFEHYRDMELQMHRFNVRSNILYDCDCDGITLAEHPAPTLTVEENVQLYGGDIRYGEMYRWEWNEAFERDVCTMWELCRKDHRQWNSLTKSMGELLLHTDPQALTVQLERRSIAAHTKTESEFYDFLTQLRDNGMILSIQYGEDSVTVTFKNRQIMGCLAKEGQVLELWTYLVLYWAKEPGRDWIYNDVQTGVVIDWLDGDREAKGHLTNEVDVMMMHGCIPVFVSCKNGAVEVEELYKLSTVAERFGGKYAKKALILSDGIGSNEYLRYIKRRAKEMDIAVVDNVVNKTKDRLENELKNLWFG